MNPERTQTRIETAQVLILRAPFSWKFPPEPQRDQRRNREGHRSKLSGKPLGQPDRNDERRHERRRNGELQKLGIEGIHKLKDAGGKSPQDDCTKQEPININVETTGVERSCAITDQAHQARESADN